jgi:Ulp1 family protease
MVSVSSSESSPQASLSVAFEVPSESNRFNTAFDKQMEVQRNEGGSQSRERLSPTYLSSKTPISPSPRRKPTPYEGVLNNMHLISGPETSKSTSRGQPLSLPTVIAKSSLTPQSPPRLIKEIQSVGMNAKRQMDAMKSTKSPGSRPSAFSPVQPSKSPNTSITRAKNGPDQFAQGHQRPNPRYFDYDLPDEPEEDEEIYQFDKQLSSLSTQSRSAQRKPNEAKSNLSRDTSTATSASPKTKQQKPNGASRVQITEEAPLSARRSGRLNKNESLNSVDQQALIDLSDEEDTSSSVPISNTSSLGIPNAAPEGESPWLTDSQLLGPPPSTHTIFSETSRPHPKRSQPKLDQLLQESQVELLSDLTTSRTTRQTRTRLKEIVESGQYDIGARESSRDRPKPKTVAKRAPEEKDDPALPAASSLSLDIENDGSMVLDLLLPSDANQEEPKKTTRDQFRIGSSPSPSIASPEPKTTTTRNIFANSKVPVLSTVGKETPKSKPSHGLSAASPPPSSASSSAKTAKSAHKVPVLSAPIPSAVKKGISDSLTLKIQVGSGNPSTDEPKKSHTIAQSKSTRDYGKESWVQYDDEVDEPASSRSLRGERTYSKPSLQQSAVITPTKRVVAKGSIGESIDAILETLGSPSSSHPTEPSVTQSSRSQPRRKAKKSEPELIELSDDDQDAPSASADPASSKSIKNFDPYDTDEDYIAEGKGKASYSDVLPMAPTPLPSDTYPESQKHFHLQYFQDDIGRGHVSADPPSIPKEEENGNEPSSTPSLAHSQNGTVPMDTTATPQKKASSTSTPLKQSADFFLQPFNDPKSLSQQHQLVFQSSMSFSICQEGIVLWKVLPEQKKLRSKSTKAKSSAATPSDANPLRTSGITSLESPRDKEKEDSAPVASKGVKSKASSKTNKMDVDNDDYVPNEEDDVDVEGLNEDEPLLDSKSIKQSSSKSKSHSKQTKQSKSKRNTAMMDVDEAPEAEEETPKKAEKSSSNPGPSTAGPASGVQGGKENRVVENQTHTRLGFIPKSRIVSIDVYSQPALFFIRTSAGDAMTNTSTSKAIELTVTEATKLDPKVSSKTPASSSSIALESAPSVPEMPQTNINSRKSPRRRSSRNARSGMALDLSATSISKDSALDLSYDISAEDEAVNVANQRTNSNGMEVDEYPSLGLVEQSTQPVSEVNVVVSSPSTPSTGLFLLACDRDDLLNVLHQLMDLSLTMNPVSPETALNGVADEKTAGKPTEEANEEKTKKPTVATLNGFEIVGRDWNLREIPTELSVRWWKPEMIAEVDKESLTKVTPIKKPKTPIASPSVTPSSSLMLPKVMCKRILDEQIAVEGQKEDVLISASAGYCKPYGIGGLEATKKLLMSKYEEVRKELFGSQWPMSLIFPCLRGLVHSSIQNSPPLYLPPPNELFHRSTIPGTVATRTAARKRETSTYRPSNFRYSLLRNKDQVVIEFPAPQKGVEEKDDPLKAARRPTLIDSVRIHQQDIDRLVPGVFLNDILVDFYLKYIQLRLMGEEGRKRVRIFRTHFYTLLSEHGYSRISSWTQQQNMFDFDFIIVPINLHLHWKVAVICNPGKANPSHIPDRKRASATTGGGKSKSSADQDEDFSPVPKKSRSGPPKPSQDASSPPNHKKRGRDAPLGDSAETDSLGLELELNENEKSLFPIQSKRPSTTSHEQKESHSKKSSSVHRVQEDASNGPTPTKVKLSIQGSSKETSTHNQSSSDGKTHSSAKKASKSQASTSTAKDSSSASSAGSSNGKPKSILPGSIDSPDQCCILILDSLGAGRDGTIATHLRTFMTEEAKKWNRPIAHFNASNMTSYHPKVPQQNNYTDCGLFLLHYMERFCLDLPKDLSRDYVLRHLMGEDWFPTEEVDGKRRKIASCIDMLFKEAQPKV